MASPFSVFRRNQRMMLAFFGVIIMLGFVVGDPLFKYLGHAGGSENPVVVKANSHSYHASELAALMQSRQAVKIFLQRLALEWVQKAAEARRVSGPQIATFAENLAENWRRELMHRDIPPQDIPTEGDDSGRLSELSMEEAAAIQTVVLAAAAEKHGFVVTDRVINDFLKTITRGMITPAEFEKIVGNLHGDARNISQSYLFEALRRELLAVRYGSMFRYQFSLDGLLPSPRWEYFQQLNRRANAEVLAVPVERFVNDVPEPSDSQLRAFFEQYAQTIPVPNSPTPGFKRPVKAVFQYFLAKVSDFTEKATAQVTPEEMQAYYEKNKDVRFQKRKPPAVGDLDVDSDDAKSGGTPSSGTSSGDAPAADSSKDSPAPQKSDTPPAGGETKPAAPGAAPAPSAGPEKKSSQSISPSLLHLVAQAQKPGDKTPAAAAKAAGTPPAAAQPADTTPAAKPADTTPAADSAAEKPAADSAEAKSAATEEAASDAAADDKPVEKKPVEYEPFEKVEDEIRKTLVDEKARRMIDDAFQRLSVQMRAYRGARGVYEANKEEESDLTPPEPLDLPALASAEGLTAHETDPVSADEAAADTDLGKSFTEPVADRRSPYGYRIKPFVEIGFNERLFTPEQTEDNEGNRYLSWKTKETPEGVPEFDEVRREVARVFKLIEARKLAVAAAEQLAKEARKAEKPLSELFAGREGFEVVETGPFTWMTIGSVPFDPGSNQPRLSVVHGVQAAGEEFMRAVFDSTPDQVGVGMNEPKTIAYVFQIKGFEPPQDDLEQQFLVEDFRKYAPLAWNDDQSMYIAWLHWLDQQAGVTWLKPGATGRHISD